MVWDDGEQREPEDWQLEVIDDVLAGYREVWQIIPEGNGKSTLIALIALYGADSQNRPGSGRIRCGSGAARTRGRRRAAPIRTARGRKAA